QEIMIQISGGPNAPVDAAPPETLEDLVRILQIKHPSKSVVVTLRLPQQNLKIQGQNLTQLPRTVLDALSPTNSAGQGIVSVALRQIEVPARHVIVGNQFVKIRVKRETE